MMKDLVKQSRSYRGYDESRKVTREELTELVDCARFTPSAMNRQPFKYYLACTQKDLDKIQPLTGWAGGFQDIKLPLPGKRPTAFIIICQETEWAANPNGFQIDAGIVAQTILLTATEKGLGGIIIGSFNPKKIAETLNLSEHLVPVLVVAIGKPDEEIVLTEIEDGESTKYYRDEQDVHYVPKRKLKDVIL